MSESCGYCNEKASELEGELVDRPDLMDPYGEENPETTKVCLRCETVLESKKKYTFVCGNCDNDFDGLMVIHDAFGTYCKECYHKEGWEKPTLTVIPEHGWGQQDIGRQVYIRGDHGTIIPDIIICTTLPGGRTCIGPGHTIGGIIARMNMVAEIQAQADQHHTIEMSGMDPSIFDLPDFIRDMFDMGGDSDDDDKEESGGMIP